MNPLPALIAYLPSMATCQIPSKAIQLHGRVVAISTIQVQMNSAVPAQIIVRVGKGEYSSGKLVLIACSVSAKEFERWQKRLPTLTKFRVRFTRYSKLEEFISSIDEKTGKKLDEPGLPAWRSINGNELNGLPFGENVESYSSIDWSWPND